MTRGISTISAPQLSEAQLSQLQGGSRPEEFVLAPSERDVLRLLGPAALESVREFGARCECDPSLAIAVTRHRSLLHPEVTPWLARDMADYLIAYHTLSNALEGAVTSKLFGALPRTTDALVTMGHNLLRYTAQELRAAIASEPLETFGAMAKLGAGRNPLWSILSYGTIEEFNACQRRAYHARLALQPGGAQVLSSCTEGEGARHADTLAKVMTMATLSELRTCSVHELRQLRDIGRQQLSEKYLKFTVQELASRPLYSLSPATGERLDTPRALVDRFLRLHCQSWSAMHELVDGGTRESQSTKVHEGALRHMDKDTQELFYSNLSRLSVLTLPRELALLPDTLFTKIQQVCKGTRVSEGTLVVPSPELSHAEQTLPASARVEVVETEVAPIDVQISLRNPEQTNEVIRYLEHAHRELLTADCKALEPIFTSCDTFVDSGAAHQHLHPLCKKLREVAAHRNTITTNLACGVLSAPLAADAISNVLSAPGAGVHVLRDLLSPPRAELFDRALSEKDRLIRNVLNYWESTGATSLLAAHYKTERLDRLDDSTYRGIRRLISQHVRDPESAEFTAQGGIIFDNYDRSSLERYLAEGNHIFVHVVHNGNSTRIDGHFHFGKVGAVPTEIDRGVMSVIDRIGISKELITFSDVLTLDKERTNGAYQRLYVRRLLTSSLEGGRYSVGFISERNEKHRAIAEAAGMVPLTQARVAFDDAVNHRRHTYVPMLLNFDNYRVPGRSGSGS